MNLVTTQAIARRFGHRRIRPGGRSRGRSRPAFTLVEMIVVIIILGVMAGVALPRLLGNDSRRVETEVQAVQRLLTIAAERGAFIPEPVAVDYDSASSTFRLMVQRRGAAFSSSRAGGGGSNARPGAREWTTDALVQPVELSGTIATNAWTDGRPLPARGWRVVFMPAEPRPALAIQLRPRSGGANSSGQADAWQVTLGPDEPAASRASPAGSAAGVPLAASRAIDLDAAGKGEKPW
ncbi:MAG: type II secretion system protein [Phycisphaerales bacterium]